jgi:hypothetical protein
LTAATGILLVDAGWQLSTSPCEPLRVQRGNDSFDPRDAVQQLADGKMSRDQWRELCARLGVRGMPLNRLTPVA